MKLCSNCLHFRYLLTRNQAAPCETCIHHDHWQTTEQTHAYRIRAKSDEELATWVETIAGCDLCPMLDEQCSGGEVNSHASCKQHWLEWLRQEAKE